MKYEAIKDLAQRCEEHPDHQTGMISGRMIEARLSEEIDELREYIEQRTWVDLTTQEFVDLAAIYSGTPLYLAIQTKLMKKNT
jgi:hypothetical protein